MTARAAAERGARVVLAARNEHDLAAATAQIRERGGRAVHHVCADAAQVEAPAERASPSSAASTPGSTTPPCRSTAGASTFPWKTCAASSTSTTVPPVYTPDVVARAILAVAEEPTLDLIVGGMGKFMSLGEKVAPQLTDKYMERTTFESQKTEIQAAADRPSNLYQPVERDGGERGHFDGRVPKWSAYTEAAAARAVLRRRER